MGKVGKIFREGLLKNVKDGFAENQGAFVLSYSCLTAAQMDELRRGMQNLNVRVYVSKNRIAKLALKDIEYGELADSIEDQTAFVWTNEDMAAVSKALVEFEKDFESIKIKGGVLNGDILGGADVKRLADLPSKEVLQAQLLGIIVAPITRLAGALNAKTRDLLSILKQLSEQKGGNNDV